MSDLPTHISETIEQIREKFSKLPKANCPPTKEPKPEWFGKKPHK